MLYQIAVTGREAPALPDALVVDSVIDDDDALVLTVEVSADDVSAYEAALAAEPAVTYWRRLRPHTPRQGVQY